MQSDIKIGAYSWLIRPTPVRNGILALAGRNDRTRMNTEKHGSDELLPDANPCFSVFIRVLLFSLASGSGCRCLSRNSLSSPRRRPAEICT
jgi:hypothetical protein